MNSRVVVVDYGMGNVASVKKAFLKQGAEDVKISRDKEDILQATHIVLPGVGAFGDAIKNLRSFGLVDILTQQVIDKKIPFLGICLGMQILVDVGYEFGKNNGLGWVSGETIKLETPDKMPLPHVGWNTIDIKDDSILLRDIPDNDFYFVHSYHVKPADDSVITSICSYGQEFVSSMRKDNIFAVQFHPEKSQKSGLKLISNFLEISHA